MKLFVGLDVAGLETMPMETRQEKGALKAMPIKTDRLDAAGIARRLHMGWFRPGHCKSLSAQKIRAVLSGQKAIQQGMIASEMSLRGCYETSVSRLVPMPGADAVVALTYRSAVDDPARFTSSKKVARCVRRCP